jgi:CobQ-like glutamine amidotransferase family enzyme
VDLDGREHDGLGLLDVRSSLGAFIDGPVVGTPAFAPGLPELAGFESHRGRSVVGPGALHFARLEVGTGNGGEPLTDGAAAGRVFGTYVHGPLLAWNPDLADHLLGLLVGAPLGPIADERDFAAEVRARRTAEARQALEKRR